MKNYVFKLMTLVVVVLLASCNSKQVKENDEQKRREMIEETVKQVIEAQAILPDDSLSTCGEDSDYMADKNGEPLYINLGKFIPDSNWRPSEGLRQLLPTQHIGLMTSEKEYKIRKEAGIPYTILLSKDGKRVVRILTKSLQYAIDKDNSVPTGKELYWPGHFKSLDGKETLDWNPKFTAIGVTVTDDAQKAIEYAKSVYAKYTDPTSVTETVGLQN